MFLMICQPAIRYTKAGVTEKKGIFLLLRRLQGEDKPSPLLCYEVPSSPETCQKVTRFSVQHPALAESPSESSPVPVE
jgi:hypothetical protein